MKRETELERVARLRAIFGGGEGVARVGIGDDAAVLDAPPGEVLVWTIDAQVEGVHFERAWLSLEDIGYRSMMAAASDLAAMGARPLGALSALVLPTDVDGDALSALARGQRAAADAIGAAVLGGNLARGGELSVTTTLLGATARPITRTGARPGDALHLTGPVGLSGAGLALLRADPTRDDPCTRMFRRPLAHVARSPEIAAHATAAIDVSDGLLRDASHVADASGVSLVLDAAVLLSLGGDALAEGAAAAGKDPLALALGGGEDYVVLFAAAVEAAVPSPRVGVVEAAGPEGPRVRVRMPDGSVVTPAAVGFDHFGA